MKLIKTKKSSRKLINKVKIKSDGSTTGTWFVTVSNIHDADLYDVEVAILALFNKKKKKFKK